MHFTLVRSLAPDKTPCPIENIKTGQISYIGQIMKQLGFNTLGPKGQQCYTLSEIKAINIYSPFIIRCNGRIVQTDLSSHIINTVKENEYRITKLLTEHNITVTFID